MGGQRGENYRRRHIALKWILVTSFGYLGYRNARFGRIEAHEAVTAFGREKLLQAKEIGERRGFRLIHAITDSLWISKDSLTEGEVLVLCEEITREAGIPMNLEGIYRWMVFQGQAGAFRGQSILRPVRGWGDEGEGVGLSEKRYASDG